MNLTKKNKILYLVTLILVVGGDLFTKHLVSSSMLLGHERRGAREKITTQMGGDLCDYPQVLLFAPSHIARKGECEGETFAGFPTRVQSPARRRPILRSKIAAPKKRPPKGWSFFLERATRLEPASRHPTNGCRHSQEPCLTS